VIICLAAVHLTPLAAGRGETPPGVPVSNAVVVASDARRLIGVWLALTEFMACESCSVAFPTETRLGDGTPIPASPGVLLLSLEREP